MLEIEHENQYRYNEDVLSWFTQNNSTFFDWMITITFYTALHKIDQCLHKRGFGDSQLSNHKKRNNLVINNLPPLICTEYIKLYSKSREVRYEQDTLCNITSTELQNFLNIWFTIIKPFI